MRRVDVGLGFVALTATNLSIRHHRRPFLPETSLKVKPGELALVVGDPGPAHAALALTLAGRFNPPRGTVNVDGESDPKRQQQLVGLIDVPTVSEPDDAVPVATIIGEELAMGGESASPRAVRGWAGENDIPLESHMEHLTPTQRVRMMGRLGALRGTPYLVFVLPERFGGRATDWLTTPRELAAAGHGVVVTCSHGHADHLDELRFIIGAKEDQ